MTKQKFITIKHIHCNIKASNHVCCNSTVYVYRTIRSYEASTIIGYTRLRITEYDLLLLFHSTCRLNIDKVSVAFVFERRIFQSVDFSRTLALQKPANELFSESVFEDVVVLERL